MLHMAASIVTGQFEDHLALINHSIHVTDSDIGSFMESPFATIHPQVAQHEPLHDEVQNVKSVSRLHVLQLFCSSQWWYRVHKVVKVLVALDDKID
jgi:hypothetical protein